MVVIKIFDAKDTNFNTAGNIIIEPLYCHEIKKKSLNGWYIDVEIPINYKEFIGQDKLCVVQTKSKLNPQAFRIKNIEYTTNKIVFQAQHVMFDAEDYFLLDSRPTNQNGLNVLNYINGMTDKVSPFTIYSNVENISTAYLIRKNLLEAWSIIEERWGGVFDADNWNISFLTSVGNDKGETIYYGKNLEDMKIIEDWSGVCTKLYPVGKDEIMLADKYLESTTQYDIPYTRTIKFDTQLDDEEQTEENLLNELKTNAINYLQENCVPKVCYEINSNINQEMEIGDIIQVKHPLCNIATEVLEYEYDVILGKITKLVFGNYSKDVKKKFKAVTNTIESIKEAVNKQQTTINNQTNLINSLNKNGYVYIDENEILLLDAIPKEKAKNVWRFGLAGIGFSSNGYEGPFEVAITMDGQINANFITTGTMSVSRIEGLANFISETEKQIAEIEIEQGKITSKISSVETKVTTIEGNVSTIEGNIDTIEGNIGDIQYNIVNLQSQIDGSIQFWNGSEIPTVENYPASEWTTEEAKNNHRADIYTVIEDVDGELKQGKSYRFDKVGDTWQWIELTDNELSAVQALATSKAKVFVTTPTVPYSVGDLWLNNGKLYRCKTAKDSNGTYSESDWEEAVDYTDDTVAELAKTLANNAQSTADSAVEGVNNITNTQGEAEGKNIHIEDSAEEPFVDIELYGETSQKTRSGKNIFNIFDENWKIYNATKQTDGSIKANIQNYYYISIQNTTDYWKNYIMQNKGRTLTFSQKEIIDGYALGIVIYGTRTSTTNGYQAIEGSGGTRKISVTIADDFTSVSRVELRTLRKQPVAAFTDTTTVISELQIEQGTTATDYEPYGVMPSPDYPSEIENLEGRNLFNKNNYSLDKTNTIMFDTSKLIEGKQYTFSSNLPFTAFKISTHRDDYNCVYYSNSAGFTSFTFTMARNENISKEASLYILLKTPEDWITDINQLSEYKIQIEKGTVATPYVPYNSLEFKVEGKNRFDSNALINKGAVLQDDGSYYFATKMNNANAIPFYSNKQVVLSGLCKYVTDTSNRGNYFQFTYSDGTRDNGFANTNKMFSNKYDKFKIVSDATKVVVAIGISYGFEIGTYFKDIQLEEGTVATEYEKYVGEQIAYFPLAEGQKLMEGSYLADDGVHHSRKQVILGDITSLNSGTIFGVECQYATYSLPNAKKVGRSYDFMSDRISPANEIFGQYKSYRNGKQLLVLTTADDTVENFNSKISGSIVEYELAEPETVPYTEKQQEAWNNIKALMTYKNITNITSTAYAKVTYMRDNGLDVYETKQNASKKYTETSEKLAEQKITVDGVITTVSDITSKTDELTGEVKTINSEISTVKQTVEGWSSDLKNTGGNNVFYYSLDFWDNSNGLEEYSDTEIMQNSISQAGYVLNNGSAKQTQSVKNGFYTCSFNYKKLLELAVCQVKINGITYDLTETDWAEFEQAFEVKTNKIEIEFISDTDSSLYISDLMINVGTTKLSWSQNANETRTDTVTIGKGIQVNSSAKNTYHRIDADGNRTFNKATGKVVNEATDKGTETEELVVRGQAKITGLLIQKVSDQVWINSLL